MPATPATPATPTTPTRPTTPSRAPHQQPRSCQPLADPPPDARSRARLLVCCPLPQEVVVANTLPLPPSVLKTTRKVRQLSVGKLRARTVRYTSPFSGKAPFHGVAAQ